jgi:PAS domain S-box-containing protein
MNFNNFVNFVKALSDYQTLIITDFNGVINWVDESFSHLTGYGSEEVIGKKISMLRSEFTKVSLFESMRTNLLNEQPWKHDFINKKKDGSLFRVEAIIFPLHENQENLSFGAVWRYRSTLICNAERSLRIKDEKGFYIIHDKGEIYTVNSNHPWIRFASNQDSALFQIFVDSITQDNSSSDVQECKDALLLGESFLGERTITVNCPGQRELMYFTLYSGSYCNSSIFYLKDITILKLDELQKIHQARLASAGEMIATIAHQWKQPLNVISASLIDTNFGLSMGEYSKDDYSSNLKIIDDQVKFLANTIQTFTRFLDLNINKSTFLLIDTLNSALEITSQRIKKRSVKINLEVSGAQVINGISEEMVHVFINIINNSIDAYERNNSLGLELSFRSYEKDNTIFIEIQDNAGGIKYDIIDKIFDPYFSTNQSKHGTGIGLYIVEKTIQEHFDGHISVKNNLNGVLFTISVPRPK